MLPPFRRLSLVCLLLACACAQRPEAFAWSRQEIQIGKVFRDGEAISTVPWSIVGPSPIEMVGLRTSCGCVVPELSVDGKPWAPGIYPSGTRGELLLRVRPKRAKQQLSETVPMLWRFKGEDDLHVAELRVRAEVLEDWRLTPASVQLTNVPAGEAPKLELRWHALAKLSGLPKAECEVAAVHLEPAETVVAADGATEIVVRGSIVRPAHAYEVRGRIQLRGLEPAAPEVPVQVTFARNVSVSPQHVVTLAAQPDGRFAAQLRLTAAEGALHGAELRPRFVMEPDAMAHTLTIETVRLSPRELQLSISCPREAATGRRFGTLVIHHGIETDPPISLLWYLQG